MHHFPLPKFCRWWETRNLTRGTPCKETQTGSLPCDIHLLKNCIEILEVKLNGVKSNHKNECIVNNFFERSEDSCNPSEIPDLLSLKLRGGGSKHKVALKSENMIEVENMNRLFG